MIRDGKMVGLEPGIPIRYYNPGISFGAYGTLPVPDNLTTDLSTGAVIDAQYIRRVCLDSISNDIHS